MKLNNVGCGRDCRYMGLGADWPVPTTSWAELNYTNMCVNSCWELYGAVDRAHLPSSGSRYDIKITKPSADAFRCGGLDPTPPALPARNGC
jgi:hypothetical protein